ETLGVVRESADVRRKTPRALGAARYKKPACRSAHAPARSCRALHSRVGHPVALRGRAASRAHAREICRHGEKRCLRGGATLPRLRAATHSTRAALADG